MEMKLFLYGPMSQIFNNYADTKYIKYDCRKYAMMFLKNIWLLIFLFQIVDHNVIDTSVSVPYERCCSLLAIQQTVKPCHKWF